MKILHVDLGTTWRGGQQQALTLARGLAQQGHEQALIAPASSPLAERARAAGLDVIPLAGRGLRLRAAAAIRQLLRRRPFDILHLHEAHAHTAAWLARPPRRVKRVVARRVAYRARRDPITQAKYRRGAERFIAISAFVRQSLMDSGVSPEDVELVYDGIELPRPPTAEDRSAARASFGFGERDIVLGCVGYLLPEKGQDRMVKALAHVTVEFPRARLLLAGDGPLREKIRRLAAKLGLGDRVRMAGFMPDVERAYGAMDAFVFPSLAEPLGSSLLVAMGYGLPVLAVAAGAVPEVIEDGKSGLLVAAAEPALLADGLRRLLAGRERWTALGDAARARIESDFTAAIMIERTERVYRSVVEGH